MDGSRCLDSRPMLRLSGFPSVVWYAACDSFFYCYHSCVLVVSSRIRNLVLLRLCIWLSCDTLNHVGWCFYLRRDEKNRKRRIRAGNRMTIDVAMDGSDHLAKHLKPWLLHKVVAYVHSASWIVMCGYRLP